MSFLWRLLLIDFSNSRYLVSKKFVDKLCDHQLYYVKPQ
jgi:hypothetical protein